MRFLALASEIKQERDFYSRPKRFSSLHKYSDSYNYI